MELRDRKLINNAKHILPKFDLGTEIAGVAVNPNNKLGLFQSPEIPAGGLKLSDDTLKKANSIAMSNLPTKNTLGGFLKKNADSMAETGM